MFTVGNNATCICQLEGKNKPLGKTIPSLCQLQLFPELEKSNRAMHRRPKLQLGDDHLA